MEKVKIWITLATCLPLSCVMYAQEHTPSIWNLRTCIEYALRKNVTIQRKELQVRDAEINMKSSKAALFPSLSASVGQRIENRPNTQSSTFVNGDNVTTSQSKTSYNGSYRVSVNWTLYNGGELRNTIRQQQISKGISELNLEESKNALTEDIIQTYLHIFYAKESVHINERTLQVSEEQYKRGKELLDVGTLSISDLAQLRSQVSTDRYQLVSAQATLQDYKLQLKQLLEIQITEDMTFVPFFPSEDDVLDPLPELEQVYQTAFVLRPEIKAGLKYIENAQLGVKIAKAKYFPTLNLSAEIGSSHTNGNNFSFGEQIKQNWSNSLGLTVSFSIFNNNQAKSTVQKAQVEMLNYELQLEETEKQLYKTIENLWYDAKNAQLQYMAAKEKRESAQASFDLVNEQFNLGMKNTIELLTEKNNLTKACQECLQAKYLALLASILLSYYQGENTFRDL